MRFNHFDAGKVIKMADESRARFRGTDELPAYIFTRDYSEFLAIQEELFLRIMDVVEEAGTGFAFPSQTTYLGRDTGLDPEKTRAAVAAVERWREEKQVP